MRLEPEAFEVGTGDLVRNPPGDLRTASRTERPRTRTNCLTLAQPVLLKERTGFDHRGDRDLA